MLPAASGFIVGAQLAPQLVKHFRVAHVIITSLLVAALGLAIFALVGAESSVIVVICGSVLLALGSSPAVTLVTDLVVSHAPAERAGAASALSETCGELGGALGIAILGTIGSSLYRMRMGQLSAAPRTSIETLSGALAAAEGMPRAEAVLLIAQARAAFAHGMHLAMVVAALVTVSSAILVYIRLGRSPTNTMTIDSSG